MENTTELLNECKLQLEYLSRKFGETGTTNALLVKISAALQQPPVSGSLPPFPDWNEAVKGIDDSRFDDMPNCYAVREGARIMYDRLYSMLLRRQ